MIEVLGPVDQEQEALVVDQRDVAGVEPAVVVDAAAGGLGVVPVALEHVGALDPDLAGVADQHVLAVDVDQADLDAVDRRADRARPPRQADRGGDDGRGLGEAVALADLEAEAGADGLGDVRVEVGGTGGGHLDGGERVGGQAGHGRPRRPHLRGAGRGTVTPCFWMASMADIGSNRSTSSTEAPACRAVPSTTLSPKMWNIGSTPKPTSAASPSPRRAMTCSRLASRLPCESIAALGEPAVPLVKMSTARSSALAVDDGQRRRLPSRSSSRIAPSSLDALAVDHELQHRAGGCGRCASAVARPAGPTSMARAPTAASSRSSSRGGLSGLSGTATAPAPSTAR